MWNGVINVYKPKGFTSHDVVAKMRGIMGMKKIGHTGTLDPLAEGVLPVCLGNGTRLCDMLTEKEKEYEAVLLLGKTTDTQDITGTVVKEREVVSSEEEVREAIKSFEGEYDQIPPMYSALKVNGKKLYELARAGKEVERKARRVVIYEIQILQMDLPYVKIRVLCSKGTYIRTLCEDIGGKLGCGGCMTQLVRTKVGRFCLQDAVTLERLQQSKEEGTLEQWIVRTDACFENCPALHIRETFEKLVENGNSFSPLQTQEGTICPDGQWVRIYATGGRFYGIYAYDSDKSIYRPVKMFL